MLRELTTGRWRQSMANYPVLKYSDFPEDFLKRIFQRANGKVHRLFFNSFYLLIHASVFLCSINIPHGCFLFEVCRKDSLPFCWLNADAGRGWRLRMYFVIYLLSSWEEGSIEYSKYEKCVPVVSWLCWVRCLGIQPVQKCNSWLPNLTDVSIFIAFLQTIME